MSKRSSRSLVLFLAAAAAFFVALRVLGHVHQYVLLWPVSAVEVALLLPHSRPGSKRHPEFLAIGLGVVTGGLLVKMPWNLASLLALLTCIDVFLGCWLMGGRVRAFDDLKQRANVYRFGVTATIAPLVTGLIGALPVARFIHAPAIQTGEMAILANAIGFVLILPMILFITTGEYRSLKKLAPHLTSGSLSLGLFFGVAVFVFWQNQGPFLFFVFPPMILALLFWGLEGAVFISLALCTIGWFATAHGHGPLFLVRNATPDDRLVLLQVFVWMSAATALPVGSLLDERRRAEQAAEEAQSIYKTLLQNSPDVIILSSLNGTQRYVSPAVEQLTGWSPDEFLSKDRYETFHPEDQAIASMILESLATGKREHSIRYRMMKKDGSWGWVEAIVRGYGTTSNHEVAGYVGTIRDISDYKQEQESWRAERESLHSEKRLLTKLASIDPLTQLLNRRGFDEVLTRQTSKRMGILCLLMIDVDYFKLYNDAYGHQQGDACLTELGRVFTDSIGRIGDVVARLGGEEFAVLLPDTSEAGAGVVAEGILEDVRSLAWEHQGSPFQKVTVSIGITSWAQEVRLDSMLLMQQADRALYASKENGRNRATMMPSAAPPAPKSK